MQIYRTLQVVSVIVVTDGSRHVTSKELYFKCFKTLSKLH